MRKFKIFVLAFTLIQLCFLGVSFLTFPAKDSVYLDCESPGDGLFQLQNNSIEILTEKTFFFSKELVETLKYPTLLQYLYSTQSEEYAKSSCAQYNLNLDRIYFEYFLNSYSLLGVLLLSLLIASIGGDSLLAAGLLILLPLVPSIFTQITSKSGDPQVAFLSSPILVYGILRFIASARKRKKAVKMEASTIYILTGLTLLILGSIFTAGTVAYHGDFIVVFIGPMIIGFYLILSGLKAKYKKRQ